MASSPLAFSMSRVKAPVLPWVLLFMLSSRGKKDSGSRLPHAAKQFPGIRRFRNFSLAGPYAMRLSSGANFGAVLDYLRGLPLDALAVSGI